ncbi:MAG: hypothetical protein HQK67_12260 [Desulfamplus sp.]|nr:hypothetical protein [Desulfamplus sp.]
MSEGKETKYVVSSEMETESVTIAVNLNHPLLQLNRALPWDAIGKIMIQSWREAGKNVDNGPGQPWDSELYIPIIVFMIVKGISFRLTEEYISDNAPARIFISRHTDPTPHIRDHSNIARAYAALGLGIEEVNNLVLKLAVSHGFGDAGILSGDTTAQELPIGYPNEPGILRGIAQRCGRALKNMMKKGVDKAASVIETAEKIILSEKEHHLFAKEKEEKESILKRVQFVILKSCLGKIIKYQPITF